MPTPTPYPEIFKAEFVSLPLLILQIFIVVCVIAVIVVAISKVTAEPERTAVSPSVTYANEILRRDATSYINRTGRYLPISLLNDDDEEETVEEDDDADGFITCSYCGTSNNFDARACAACGAPRKKAFA